MPIAARFWFALGVLGVALATMGGFAFAGLSRTSDSAIGVSRIAYETGLDVGTHADLIEFNDALKLYAQTDDSRQARELRVAINDDIDALVLRLAEMRRLYAHRPVDRRLTLAQERPFRAMVALWRDGAVRAGRDGGSSAVEEAGAVRRLNRIGAPMVRAGNELQARDADLAADGAEHVGHTYASTRDRMIVVFGVTVVLGIGLILWLIQSVVPRTRRYSRFAAGVSAGHTGERLAPEGDDELAELGRSLDDMVARHEAERDYQRGQAEFVDALQVTESEGEAHELITVHLQRSVDDSQVVVLSRNNSDDRLEAKTPVEPGSPLADGLDGANPRACLAVRFGRRHASGGEVDPLLACGVCGKTPDMATCSPLLVGGQVIGAVLMNHPEDLDRGEDMRIRDSVTQAAPVLANLRNLAIAELRAATDVLTGLPNNRAVRDTLRRMVAQASRTGSPLTAALVDLDHFKQINDTYGHGRGDEVLAAAADAMRAAVRESDFVGRYGGEEFLILLPETDLSGGLAAAETVRAAIAAVTLTSVDRAVTASIGVAVLPEDGTDAETLVRNADRALYSAKSKGRNRVETTLDPAASQA